MLRSAAALLCLSLPLACLGQTAPTDAALQKQIEAITEDPAVARAHWGVSVTGLSGTNLASLNDGQFFQPASNAKLFTTAAAMALLPMREQLKTDVIASGYFRPGGEFEGDLVLRGVGDANVSGRPVPFQPSQPGPPEPPRNELRYIEELADQVKAIGITRVNGSIVGDDSLFPWDPYPADWAIDDTPWYYGAPINALMIADNAVTLTVMPGSRLANATSAPQALITPNLPYYTIDMQATTGARGSETQLDMQRSIGERTIHIYGNIAADAKPYVQDMSIADPAEYAALALQSALEQRGITITGKARAKHQTGYDEPSFTKTSMQPVNPLALSAKRRLLLDTHGLTTCQDCGADWASRVVAEHTSTPWIDDIAVTNKTSQNQHAELLLRQLGFAYGLGGTTIGGARVVRTFLTATVGIDPEDFVFYDGSGLSGHDLVTPRAITQLLRYAVPQPWGLQWKASLPIGGVDGSLRSRFTDASLKNHVFAKTGTLGEARALSGYLQCASGKTVTFSIMVSTHSPLNNEDARAIDRIVAAIAAAE